MSKPAAQQEAFSSLPLRVLVWLIDSVGLFHFIFPIVGIFFIRFSLLKHSILPYFLFLLSLYLAWCAFVWFFSATPGCLLLRQRWQVVGGGGGSLPLRSILIRTSPILVMLIVKCISAWLLLPNAPENVSQLSSSQINELILLYMPGYIVCNIGVLLFEWADLAVVTSNPMRRGLLDFPAGIVWLSLYFTKQ